MTASPPTFERAAAFIAALYCGAAIGLGAYGAHAAAVENVARLERASLYLLLHGIAVYGLALTRRPTLVNRSICSLLLVGTALFSGSLIALALAGMPAVLAPAGGVMMMLGWAVAALALLRRSTVPAID